MTEEEWLESARVLTPLMNWLRHRGTDRQFFMLAAAWVRQVESKMIMPHCIALIPFIESYADGETPHDTISYLAKSAERDAIERMNEDGRWTSAVTYLAADIAAARAATPPDGWLAAINALKECERCDKHSSICPILMAILRDIFGNPFRPVAFNPEWRTSNVVSLARSMYDSRDFGAMPILSDALQDAGCEQADILDHCRGPGPHVRGCWVVDLILGKG